MEWPDTPSAAATAATRLMKLLPHEGIHDSGVYNGYDVVNYLYRVLPGDGDFTEMQDQSRGRVATLEHDSFALERQYRYP